MSGRWCRMHASQGKDIEEIKQVEREWSLQDVRNKVEGIEDREYNDVKTEDFFDVLARYYIRKIICQDSHKSRQRLKEMGWWRQEFDLPADESDQTYRERMKRQASQDKEEILNQLQERELAEKKRLKKEQHKVQLKQRIHRWCKIMKSKTEAITTATYDAMSNNKRETQMELTDDSTTLLSRIERLVETSQKQGQC